MVRTFQPSTQFLDSPDNGVRVCHLTYSCAFFGIFTVVGWASHGKLVVPGQYGMVMNSEANLLLMYAHLKVAALSSETRMTLLTVSWLLGFDKVSFASNLIESWFS